MHVGVWLRIEPDHTPEIEHIELFLQRPDREARRALVNIYRPLARGLANRYAQRGEDIEDLEQVAMVGLINAIDRFDPSHGVPFRGYAVPTILGELKRHFRDRGWAMRVPRGMQEMSALTRRARDELEQRLGRSPTVEEIAQALDLSAEEVSDADALSGAYRTRSTESDHEQLGFSPIDEMGDDDPGFSVVLDLIDLKPIFESRPERERLILYLRFYRDMTQREIAAIVGMSQMNVSRILTASLEQMKTLLTV